ncbi:MAG: ABC transporter substrate-binding protein [Candidatus Cloacimonadaceae bacterium]|jgi:ABC-type nitrate/sulfonate/bicarbonate transport system substrate-binding protein|nr:ABC transporter substrate-binding protein [Candidatus Cloacimonadota bacterium]MDY0112031.1 ABC transporter substrate-binding protein [Candidatus Syntrophosphaera sp.]
MKKQLIVLTVIIAIILPGLTACKKKAKTEANLQKVRVVLDWTPNTNHTGIYVAQELGYYKDKGLEVEILQPGENTVEKIIASDQAEFGVSYQESVTIARSENIPVKSIAAIIQHNTSGFASLKSANITSPKDFEGKRYGSSGWPSELEILKQVMESSGADFKKVQIVYGITDFFSTIGKDVDFAWIYYGWDGVQSKLREIELNYIPVRELNPVFDFYTPVLIANDQLLNSEPELVKAFLEATSKGYEYCVQHPDSAADILWKAVPELDKNQVKASLEYLKTEFISDAPQWGIQDLSVWQNFADWMYQKHIIQKSLKAQELFTNEFLPNATNIKS